MIHLGFKLTEGKSKKTFVISTVLILLMCDKSGRTYCHLPPVFTSDSLQRLSVVLPGFSQGSFHATDTGFAHRLLDHPKSAHTEEVKASFSLAPALKTTQRWFYLCQKVCFKLIALLLIFRVYFQQFAFCHFSSVCLIVLPSSTCN